MYLNLANGTVAFAIQSKSMVNGSVSRNYRDSLGNGVAVQLCRFLHACSCPGRPCASFFAVIKRLSYSADVSNLTACECFVFVTVYSGLVEGL